MKKYMLGMSYLNAQTLIGNGIVVAQNSGTDEAQSLTSINMTNRGLGGRGYLWSLFTAAVGGGYGVRGNAIEIWEYPIIRLQAAVCSALLSISHRQHY